MSNVGVLGSGSVGEILANGLLKKGHSVMRGSRDPQKLAAWKEAAGSKASTGTFEEAARFGQMIVLAVKGDAAEDVVRLAGIQNLSGKTVLDATNPIAAKPPTNGVLSFFTSLDDSLMERLQKLAAEAHFVKCFSCVGGAHMVDPKFEVRPSMFICGNNDAAKSRSSRCA